MPIGNGGRCGPVVELLATSEAGIYEVIMLQYLRFGVEIQQNCTKISSLRMNAILGRIRYALSSTVPQLCFCTGCPELNAKDPPSYRIVLRRQHLYTTSALCSSANEPRPSSTWN
eukprot:GFKZ01007242.1.p1 GENE.GFKZ01007242.1~~GFKZ01007242.1.p1  ORF type:complete len:115 (-),score=1.97 GFKZ01007242.1:447-791(-)